MKKTMRLVAVLALCVALLVPATGLAAGFEPESPANTTTNGADGKEVIPVYGYIGQDTTIVDPDPEKPEVPPETEIYIEVPVKVLFAAFESDAGAISSPDYTITNLSTANDVKVEVESFVQRATPAVDLNGNLSLKLVDSKGADIVGGLFPGAYESAKLLAENLPKKADGSDANRLGFAIGGTWNGGFASELHPAFDMTLKFSVAV
ncbi:hypothetical protein LJC56_06695 [Christensenellaceae bacterium OttesenSCG-928-K19]|nr:hypothetical protein [Christensenellaceae bacterium OttesenSCG-928-K19]